MANPKLIVRNPVLHEAPVRPDLPEGNQGVAARYPGDHGIGNDPAVLFADGFDSGEFKDLQRNWDCVVPVQTFEAAYSGVVEPGAGPGNLSFESGAGNTPFAAGRSLRIAQNRGRDTGAGLFKRIAPGVETVFVRFYVKFAEDCTYLSHFVNLMGHLEALPYPVHDAGKAPDGRERFSTGLEPWPGDFDDRANWSPPVGLWHFYSYWHAMKPSVDGKYWGNCFEPDQPCAAPRGQWMCMEFMLQLNSTPDSQDGAQAIWKDGKLAGYWNGIRWRTSPALKITGFHLNIYVDPGTKGGGQSGGGQNAAWFDHVVLAREYIGPVVSQAPKR